MQKIHLKAPAGWINDPNGFIFYKGEYHLFYQHFPYAPCWGRMHWGHAVSRDLVNWEHKGIALFPSKYDDADGCFSGSAIEKDNKLHLFYTGVRYDNPDPQNTNCAINDKLTSAQLHICSDDGYTFDNFNGKTTVIPPISNEAAGSFRHTRDPKVWQGADGSYYMVLGSTVNNKGRILIYRSSDLESWEYINFAESENFGWMWECPDYFEVDGSGILIFSPMGLPEGNQAAAAFADFDEQSGGLNIEPGAAFLDEGLDLYAPQSTADENGRRVVIAWLRMPEPMEDGTIGMFCIPRVCNVGNGQILFSPHPFVQAAFAKKISSVREAENGCFRIQTKIRQGDNINIGGYKISYHGGILTADRSGVIRNHAELKNVVEIPMTGEAELDIYADNYIIETYINGGRKTITHAVYDLSDELEASAEYILTTTEEGYEKI